MQSILLPALALALLLAPDAAPAGAPAAPPTAAGPAPAGPLHVPSPDWRDQVVYFVLTDRFDDGDPSNNDQGAGEYDPADPSRYSGGDLAGITRRLGYIRGLGATAVWITPPVANQWLNPHASYGGYHGYWASDFGRVDPHLGTLADYQALSRALHGAGMYLVQDVVVNHVGDWLDCEAGAGRVQDCVRRSDPSGASAPAQAPFDRNDPGDPSHLADPVYHWTPTITDFSDRTQELDYALAGLDDLATGSPDVRRALRASYGHWLREAGVDAFRIDTAFHVPAEFFADFLHADDPAAPGIARVAAQTGRDDFLAFGEGFGVDAAYDDRQARKLDAYMREPGGLASMINFPLYGSLGDVFARGRPTAELGHRIESMLALHADPHRMPSFIDNHDVDRFLAGAGEPALRQALLAMLTLPGIPVIYYGTEQGFSERRRSMFAAGHGSGGHDHFDTDAPLYRYLREAIALRRGHRLFSRGTPRVLATNPAAAGALAWRIDHGDEVALVVFNTADHAVLLDGLDVGLPAGSRLAGAFGIDGTPAALQVPAGGTLDLVLPPRSGRVWLREGAAAAGATPVGAAAPRPRITDPGTEAMGGDFGLSGSAPGAGELLLVVDGNLDAAMTVPVDADGRWQARVPTGAMVDPAVGHRLVAYRPDTGAVSAPFRFRVALDWRPVADVADPRGDDRGPDGRYLPPTGAGWGGQADIERVRAWTAAGALRLELTMAGLSRGWNPANGFDRVAVITYLQLPGVAGGARVMPGQHAQLPADMRWHYRLRAHGWSNVLTSAAGANADHEGTVVTPAPGLHADADARTLTFTVPAGTLGGADALDGARLLVTTWDYDEGLRALAEEPGVGNFGGGRPGDPRILDAADVTLRSGD